jgi:hypothetical protein
MMEGHGLKPHYLHDQRNALDSPHRRDVADKVEASRTVVEVGSSSAPGVLALASGLSSAVSNRHHLIDPCAGGREHIYRAEPDN